MTTYTCKTCQNITALTAKACPNCGDVKPFKGQKMTYKESAAITYAERKGFLNGGGKMSYGKKLGLPSWVGLLSSLLLAYLTRQPKPKKPPAWKLKKRNS